MGCPRVRYGWPCLGFLGDTLFALSLLGLIAGCAVAGWAWLLQRQIGQYVNVAQPGEGYLWPGTLGLAVLLLAPVHGLGIRLRGDLVKDLASWSALRKRAHGRGKTIDRLLFVHALLSCLSGFLLLAGCIGGAYLWGQSRRRVRWGLHRALQRYASDKNLRERVDRLQIELHCCGSESYVDWLLLVPWSRAPGYEDDEEEELEEEVEEEMEESIERRDAGGGSSGGRSQEVPFSCCLTADVPQVYCVHRGTVRHRLREKEQLRFSTMGCANQLVMRGDDAGRDVVACLVFLSVYQLTLSVLSRLLQTTRRSAANVRPTDHSKRFDGWLFGRGPSPRRGQQCAAAASFLRPSAKVALSDDCTTRSMIRNDDGSCSSSSSHSDAFTTKRGETLADAVKRGTRKIEASQDEHNEEDEEEVEEECERLLAPPPPPPPLPPATVASRIFNSTDFYGRFRGTLQDTLERRKNRMRASDISFASLGPKRRRHVDNQTSSSSSSTLLSLPATPLPPPPRRQSVNLCPVHKCCPIHPFGIERKSSSNGRCPVHGDGHFG